MLQEKHFRNPQENVVSGENLINLTCTCTHGFNVAPRPVWLAGARVLSNDTVARFAGVITPGVHHKTVGARVPAVRVQVQHIAAYLYRKCTQGRGQVLLLHTYTLIDLFDAQIGLILHVNIKDSCRTVKKTITSFTILI